MIGRAVGVLLLALLLLPACRDGAPTPAPSPSAAGPSTPPPSPVTGLRVGVVLPPASLRTAAEVEAMREDLVDLPDRFGEDIASIRVVQPDGRAFIADVTDLLADRGADLVCVLGPGAGAAVRAVASRYPETRFCAAPAAGPVAGIPENVLLIDVRVEEVAFLAGVAAQLADPGASRPPAFVAGDTQYAVDRQRAAFAAGASSVAPAPVTPLVAFPAGDEERAFEVAAPWFEAGTPAIYTAAVEGDRGVLRAAQEHGGLVIGSPYTLLEQGDEGEVLAPPEAVLLLTAGRASVPVEVAVRRVLEAWAGGQASVGLAEDAFALAGGGSPRYRTIAGAVEEARARLVSGEVSPLP